MVKSFSSRQQAGVLSHFVERRVRVGQEFLRRSKFIDVAAVQYKNSRKDKDVMS